MDALAFDGYMWYPEYCDSELRALEVSGESRDELCPCTPLNSDTAQLKLCHRLTDGWYTCDQCPSDANDNKYCWDYPCSTSSRSLVSNSSL